MVQAGGEGVITQAESRDTRRAARKEVRDFSRERTCLARAHYRGRGKGSRYINPSAPLAGSFRALRVCDKRRVRARGNNSETRRDSIRRMCMHRAALSFFSLSLSL